METENEEKNKQNIKQFKSYYVVWKLSKPKPTKIKGFVFKSYYVVWKHNVKASTVNKLRRLNRTMQYGNYLKRILKTAGTQSLNRTMQYGNYIICKIYEI